MKATLTITACDRRHRATIHVDGTCIGQAIDADEKLASKRAMWQAFAWAKDRGVSLTVIGKQEAVS